MFCQVEPEQVVAVHDVSSTYHVPLLLDRQGLIPLVRDILRLDTLRIPQELVQKGTSIWKEWKSLTASQDDLSEVVTIVLVGKYTNLHDSYLSVVKSLEHAAMACSRKLKLVWVDASHLEEESRTTSRDDYFKAWHEVTSAQGVLVPGGFGTRGTEGMIAAAKWARTHNVPYLGICLGMQIAVIEFARNVCSIARAGSIELDERTQDPVVIFMPEIDRDNLGGRCGSACARPSSSQAVSGASCGPCTSPKPPTSGPCLMGLITTFPIRRQLRRMRQRSWSAIATATRSIRLTSND